MGDCNSGSDSSPVMESMPFDIQLCSMLPKWTRVCDFFCPVEMLGKQMWI